MPNVLQHSEFINKKYARLTILSFLTDKKYKHKSVLCQCDCGTIRRFALYYVVKGKSKSCGCITRERARSRRAPESHRSPLFTVWQGMKNRCHLQKNRSYKYYGARGISVCDQWRFNYIEFYNWAISNGWEKGLHIDRINNNGNYDPSNCRFVTPAQNNRNTSRNVYISFNGETMILTDWANKLGVSSNAMGAMIRRKGLDKTMLYYTQTK